MQTLRTLRLQGAIRPTQTGFVSLRARVVVVPAISGGTGADLVPLTVGDTPAESFIGYRPAQSGAVTGTQPAQPACT